MTTRNEALVREAYEAHGRGDVAGLVVLPTSWWGAGGRFFEPGGRPGPGLPGFGTFSMTAVSSKVQERAGKTAAEHLDWLGQAMLASGDPDGSAAGGAHGAAPSP